MVYKKIESEFGPYQDSDGLLYEIFEAINVMTPQGKNVGWDEFANIEDASQAYGLTYIGIQEDGQ